MTKEEAIKRLKEARTTIQPFLYVDEAIDYAIKVLESKADTWSIKEVADALEKHGLIREQEPCEDCISRQAVIELAEKGVLVSNGNYKSVCNAINELPSVNPQKSSIIWVAGADGAKVAFLDVPVWKVLKICEILGEPQESEG